MNNNNIIGAIEAGGTKFVCAIGTSFNDALIKEFKTTENPNIVLDNCLNWLRDQQKCFGNLQSIGLGSFGPIDINKKSYRYGYITTTPKKGWSNTNIVGHLNKFFPNIPVCFDTDVNAAALGEYYWGNGAGLTDFVYITIGTGIGVGGLTNGNLLHGNNHPEMGHMFIPKLHNDSFEGICPFHRNCWEGLCSGPALFKRTGILAENIPKEHLSWHYHAYYSSLAICNIIYVLSPQKIIIGGSVSKGGTMGNNLFIEKIKINVIQLLNGYIDIFESKKNIDDFIVPPMLGDNSGIYGSIALGQRCLIE